jgi:hypothetical protein
LGAHHGEGEVARPGSFAPRTLSVVRDLTKDDANIFTKVCVVVSGSFQMSSMRLSSTIVSRRQN